MLYTFLYSQKNPTFENNDLSAWGDFNVNPATFYHSLGILVLIAQLNFCAQPMHSHAWSKILYFLVPVYKNEFASICMALHNDIF